MTEQTRYHQEKYFNVTEMAGGGEVWSVFQMLSRESDF